MKIKLFITLLVISAGTNSFAQLDYNQMENWAFHPSKSGTIIDGYNIDIAVIDEDLNTDTVFQIANNAMTNTGVDVFFVHPTLLTNLSGYTTRENIPLIDQPSSWEISASILGQAGLLSKYGRFFAPRYRQASPPTFLGSPLDTTQAAIIGEAYKDIKAAFLNYLNNYNNGNKIILASHSQGAYLTAMLLRDVFDNNPILQNKLVTAILGGIVSTYATPFQLTGGWWQNVPFCTTKDQCNCVMTWRSYKEGQSLPSVKPSTPCFNPYLVDSNLVYRLLDINQDWLMQDSLYYSNQPTPLRYFITPKTNQTYGGNVGFVAFDSLYHIRHQRDGMTKVGFMVVHTPKPNDQRPNILLAEEAIPLFDIQGYHHRDYNIYAWALMQQIDLKLATCGTTTDLIELNKNLVQVFPNPTYDKLNIKSGESISTIEIFNVQGQLIKTLKAYHDKEFNISISEFSRGMIFIKIDLSNGNKWTGKLIKE